MKRPIFIGYTTMFVMIISIIVLLATSVWGQFISPTSLSQYRWTHRIGSGGPDIVQDICADNSGNIYIAVRFKGTVNFAQDWGSTEEKTSAGDKDSAVVKIDANGNYCWARRIGGPGNDSINVLCADNSGYLYVADTDNHRIQKFDSDGTFITKLGIEGTNDGEFKYPHDVAVNSLGYIYVADTNNKRVQIFDSAFNFISK